MNVSKVSSAGTMLVKGKFGQHWALQKILEAKGINFQFTLHQNYTPSEDMVFLYAFGKEQTERMSQYLQEQRRLFGYNPLKRDRIVEKTVVEHDYNELSELILLRIKTHENRIGEFVKVPEKTLPVGIVAGSVQMNYFEKLLKHLAQKGKNANTENSFAAFG